MELRTTRSMAREAALLATGMQTVQRKATITAKKRARHGDEHSEKPGNTSKRASNGRATSKRRKKNEVDSLPNGIVELPHNLGKVAMTYNLNPSVVVKSEKTHAVKEEELENLANDIQITVDKATGTLEEPTGKRKKKKTNPYGLTPGFSPFPEWLHPTREECEEVNRLLSSVHGEISPPATIPEPSLTVTGCGEVPSVLDALIRTLLSGATTGRNSAMSFNGLVQKFGILKEGIGRGSVNWDAVRQAPTKDVYEAMKSGGLADIKSKHLKAILDMVYKENQERRELFLQAELSNGPSSKEPDTARGQYEIACADQNVLSLNHLHELTKEEVMMELVKYPGIGPKTAACVILFCLQRPCFAVDTHIFRICKWLGWIPDKATEVTAFSHLEVRIPDHLKYSLHQLFILHGKSCPRCRAITGQSATGWEDGCVIDHLVTRTGKRKGGAESPVGIRRGSRPALIGK